MRSETERKGMLIAQLLLSIDEPEDMIAVVAASLHTWTDFHGGCVEGITEMLVDIAQEANGLEIEGE